MALSNEAAAATTGKGARPVLVTDGQSPGIAGLSPHGIHANFATMIRLAVLTFALTCAAAGADSPWMGMVRNTAGQPIAGLTLHFVAGSGPAAVQLTATTGPDGIWRASLPDLPWRAAPRSAELVARGYFCFPGFVWCPPELGDCTMEGQPFDPWGPGLIEWNPIIIPGLPIVSIVVPTRPSLAVSRRPAGTTEVQVAFESTTEPMQLVRQWRIEKSSDMIRWSPLRTVALSGNSPVMVPDPESAGVPQCFYRAVQVDDLALTP